MCRRLRCEMVGGGGVRCVGGGGVRWWEVEV